MSSGSASDSSMREVRVEAAQRVLEDVLHDAAAAQRAPLPARVAGDVLAVDDDPAGRTARTSPSTARASVDLPEPVSPMMPTVSPRRTVQRRRRAAPGGACAGGP